jgi:hypothetical protein
MQSLINIIRGTGATNIIQVPGEAYANVYSCSPTTSPVQCGFLDSADGVKVSDTLNPAQLMGDTDNYPDMGQDCQTTSCFSTTYGPVAQTMPIDAGETGVINSGNPFPDEQAFLNWMDSVHASYYGAAWDTWSNMISDYNGTPKAPWGTYYHDHLATLG